MKTSAMLALVLGTVVLLAGGVEAQGGHAATLPLWALVASAVGGAALAYLVLGKVGNVVQTATPPSTATPAPRAVRKPEKKSAGGSGKLTLFVGSWNMAELAPAPEAEMAKWLPRNGGHDIYAISLQECHFETTLADSVQAEMQKRIEAVLGGGYQLVGVERFNSVYCLVYVRSSLAGEVTGVVTGAAHPEHKSSVPKGGVGVSFTLRGRKYCFIGAHFPAHEHQLADRNQFYHATTTEVVCRGGALAENDVNYIFWAGDFNYRIVNEYWATVKLIKEQKLDELKPLDQLRKAQKDGDAFPGYKEGAIHFSPTYKFAQPPKVDPECGHREYDTKKLRIPSWTDRVLWKTHGGASASQKSYTACHDIMTSDHAPIRSEFELN